MENYLAFLEFEEKYQLFERKLLGVHYWQMVRTTFYELMRDSKYNLQESHPDTVNFQKKTFLLIKSLVINSFQKKNHYEKLQGKILLSVCANSEENMVSEIVQYLNNDYCVLSRPSNGKHYFEENDVNIIFTDWIDLVRSISIKCAQKFSVLKKGKCAQELEYWLGAFEDEFNCKLPIGVMVNRLLHVIITEKIVSFIFKKLFKANRPKKLVVVTHYDAFHFALIKVAHELNIPVIELQHGYISSEHMAYNYMREHLLYFPDKILTFGDYWQSGLVYPRKETFVSCGSVIGEKKYKYYYTNEERKYILFLSQGPYANMLYPLAVALYELIRTEGLEESYTIVYKLHPGEVESWNKIHPTYNNKGIKLITENGEDLYSLFNKSIMQVGVDSTALFEGLQFHIKTAVLSFTGMREDMKHLCECGYGTLAITANDLFDLLVSDNKERYDYEIFWKNNAVENIIGEIYNI